MIRDCLGHAEITLPTQMFHINRCVATFVAPGFENLLDDMLGSFYAYSGCQDASIFVFAFNIDIACERVISKYHATPIYCKALSDINTMSKTVLYSVALVVDAQQFLCLDPDILILADISPIFSAIHACPENSILVCRDGSHQKQNLGYVLPHVYGGQIDDLAWIAGKDEDDSTYSLVVNDGFFAGSKNALSQLDHHIRSFANASNWVGKLWWRNQFIFNLALARYKCGVELDMKYNVQIHSEKIIMNYAQGRLQALWNEQQARVLHFNGMGRNKYLEWRGHFVKVNDPLINTGKEDYYNMFLAALRAWVGYYGLSALDWSFYGSTSHLSYQVPDTGTFPLLACLHYLIRSNGCVKVLETGTARGVSAACLASAVSHRKGGLVVSLDPYPDLYPERTELWQALPEVIRSCIEPRVTTSLEGMTAGLEVGERYDAVLLDSIHAEEYVWAEFELASKLVCPGGLILIHDVNLVSGTVDRAVTRIAEAGYGVIRLWNADEGVHEDDRLGLAVIENRLQQRTVLHE